MRLHIALFSVSAALFVLPGTASADWWTGGDKASNSNSGDWWAGGNTAKKAVDTAAKVVDKVKQKVSTTAQNTGAAKTDKKVATKAVEAVKANVDANTSTQATTQANSSNASDAKGTVDGDTEVNFTLTISGKGKTNLDALSKLQGNTQGLTINAVTGNNGAYMPWGGYNQAYAAPPMTYIPAPLTFEQQQAQMEKMRLQFESMATKIAKQQKAAEAAHKKLVDSAKAPTTKAAPKAPDAPKAPSKKSEK